MEVVIGTLVPVPVQKQVPVLIMFRVYLVIVRDVLGMVAVAISHAIIILIRYMVVNIV
jgi:hypothetical protein